METLTHTDRRGNVWRFGIDCTRPQYDTIRGALAAVRNMGNRHALSISGLMEAERTGGLYADIEAAMLRGLAERFPVPAPPQPQPKRIEQQPATPQAAAPDGLNAADDPAPGYWWENL